MIPADRFIELLNRLLEKSKGDGVHWVRVNRDTSCVILSGSYFSLTYASPSTASDFIQVSLHQLDPPRTALAILEAEPAGENWDLMLGLYSEATRHLLKWDDVIAELEESFDSDEIIGKDSLPHLPETSIPENRLLSELAALDRPSPAVRYNKKFWSSAVEKGLIAQAQDEFSITTTGLDVLKQQTENALIGGDLPVVDERVLILLGALVLARNPLPLTAYKQAFPLCQND